MLFALSPLVLVVVVVCRAGVDEERALVTSSRILEPSRLAFPTFLLLRGLVAVSAPAGLGLALALGFFDILEGADCGRLLLPFRRVAFPSRPGEEPAGGAALSLLPTTT